MQYSIDIWVRLFVFGHDVSPYLLMFSGSEKKYKREMNDILLPKLFWPIVRKNWFSDREKLLKFEAKGQEFANFLRSLQKFIQTVKVQNNFW